VSGSSAPRGERPVRHAPGLPRPEHALGRISVGVLSVVGWSAIGHQNGSGWVVALGGLVAATLGLGLVAPFLAICTTRLVVLGAPADVEARSPFLVELACSRRVRARPISLAGDAACAAPDGGLDLVVTAARRGVLETIVVQAETAGPFGLLWWSRQLNLELPRPVHVAPRTGHPLPETLERLRRATGRSTAVPSGTGDLRGVREYRHGDSQRRVHWPATAHGMTLMVRETDEGIGTTAVVAADLPADAEAAELRAERVLGTVVELLRAGSPVQLETFEPGTGPLAALVTDRRTAGRRLARATAG
jgi:uncharacterized protein (DUF58 family)